MAAKITGITSMIITTIVIRMTITITSVEAITTASVIIIKVIVSYLAEIVIVVITLFMIIMMIVIKTATTTMIIIVQVVVVVITTIMTVIKVQKITVTVILQTPPYLFQKKGLGIQKWWGFIRILKHESIFSFIRQK